MRMIIEARLAKEGSDTGQDVERVLAVIERPDCSLADLGLTLAEGRALLAEAQAQLVSTQVDRWLSGQTHCQCCGEALSHKDHRSTVVRTVYGKVTLKSPRLWSCACQQTVRTPRHVVHPLSKALTSRTTPELKYLQAKWASQMAYRQATAMLKEVLPLEKGISFSGARNRIRTIGKQLDDDIERDIAKLPHSVADVRIRESRHVAAMSVDSAWLRHCDSQRGLGRHVNLIAGRATFTDSPPKFYAYVHREVPSAAARLDHFLSRNGVAANERVTVISDDAGEFEKTVQGSRLARGRILDWFHIAMQFNAAQRSLYGSKMMDALEREERESAETEITHAKFLVWHGKGRKAMERIKALDARLLTRTGYEYSTLSEHLRNIWYYLRNNSPTLVNYGARHRKGLPISSSIAESAVNQVVSHRMAKKRQMRWTDQGAHCLVQVRVAALNGELSPDRISALELAASRHSQSIGPASPNWHQAPHRKSRDMLAENWGA
ncbi:ISKra4 family transposase (plasmid) [Cupriavidus pinatubonensis]|uniref:ISKra4 family transposase n=1 Tax=Cupriavidus pinatubonensis TaxID=248026 RepID=UPI001C73053B|nr:ISKra4 family transposase [Cupriavidus pinatubonensis]QYY33888.1 ISKra4 family transposase [Cupriavidus pinatubonensis]